MTSHPKRDSGCAARKGSAKCGGNGFLAHSPSRQTEGLSFYGRGRARLMNEPRKLDRGIVASRPQRRALVGANDVQNAINALHSVGTGQPEVDGIRDGLRLAVEKLI